MLFLNHEYLLWPLVLHEPFLRLLATLLLFFYWLLESTGQKRVPESKAMPFPVRKHNFVQQGLLLRLDLLLPHFGLLSGEPAEWHDW